MANSVLHRQQNSEDRQKIVGAMCGGESWKFNECLDQEYVRITGQAGMKFQVDYLRSGSQEVCV